MNNENPVLCIQQGYDLRGAEKDRRDDDLHRQSLRAVIFVHEKSKAYDIII